MKKPRNGSPAVWTFSSEEQTNMVKILTAEWHPFQHRYRDNNVVLSVLTAADVLLSPTTAVQQLAFLLSH